MGEFNFFFCTGIKSDSQTKLDNYCSCSAISYIQLYCQPHLDEMTGLRKFLSNCLTYRLFLRRCSFISEEYPIIIIIITASSTVLLDLYSEPL